MKITANMKQYAARREMTLEVTEDEGVESITIWQEYDDGGEPIVKYRIGKNGVLALSQYTDQRGEDWPAHVADWGQLKLVINYAHEVAPV